MLPTKVGGVYLTGAGRLLAELGQLDGIALDASTGRLALLSKQRGALALPPLRLEDVVTVFRSVYEHGQGPSVSIDPDPQDPKGPRMPVRHGKGTENTYVGWVLFEADRLMKAYSLGCDNVSGTPLTSGVAGYQDLVQLHLANPSARSEDSLWERFWIVPAEVHRRRSQDRSLTLVDLSLKVRTERMELRGGKLVTASNPAPSPAASGFSDWFTTRYGDIAREARSTAPDGAASAPVSVLGELNRIALIAAMAEALRDQGVPIPDWMTNYPVPAVATPKTTPSLLVGAGASCPRSDWPADARRSLSIFGGVSLSPEDRAVRTTPSAEADGLAAVLPRALAGLAPISKATIEAPGATREIVTLPGPHAQDVGALQLQDVDIALPVREGRELRLVRKFSSFFKPDDVFGGSWTLDLPRLEQQLVPVRREKDKTEFKVIYRLMSSLGSVAASFSSMWSVAGGEGTLAIPTMDDTGMAGVGLVRHSRLGESRVVLLGDGRRWHFNDTGLLAAIEDADLLTVYQRDSAQRVVRIETWRGASRAASIGLDYDARGRVSAAGASDGSRVRYLYDKDGLLERVESNDRAKHEYAYRNGLVSRVRRAGQSAVEFEYNEQGQITAVRPETQRPLRYERANTSNGISVALRREGTVEPIEVAEYDLDMRPRRRRLADGTRVEWFTDPAGHRSARVQMPDGGTYTVVALDGKRTIRSDGGDELAATVDAQNRLSEVRLGKSTLLRQQWLGDGRPARFMRETGASHLQYRPDGRVTALMLTAPVEGRSFDRWLKVSVDDSGMTHDLTDYSGGRTTMVYGPGGEVRKITTNNAHIEISRDAMGRVTDVRSDLGFAQENKYARNSFTPSAIRIVNGGQSAALEFDAGRITKLRKFDGSEIEFFYHPDASAVREIGAVRMPDGTILRHEYDDKGRVASEALLGIYRSDFRYDGNGRALAITRAPATRE